jgi:hypothetical protein
VEKIRRAWLDASFISKRIEEASSVIDPMFCNTALVRSNDLDREAGESASGSDTRL